uniref:Histone-lysine N-methyltransferase ASHH1 n=1 Tax=Kalanchoe fedtschenkoi TaxID=63787 RepID=A0A7N0V2U0_KALFE
MDLHAEERPHYIHIDQNEFTYRKQKKQKEEDIAVCVCRLDLTNLDNSCGERCLNVLTSTECTPGYCPCDVYCRNQKFQRCGYSKTKLVKTEGRGWGLIADENIKTGQFIIEYCGEVISSKEAWRRFLTYESQGLKDAYIMTLDAHEAIDATKKGNLARFINHSCQPNCETRKWNVQGEVRLGIFAKQDIHTGTELAYNYNFEWYGGAKVRCLCGAASCSGFLGAKSRAFMEDTYLWEDNDDRYAVEKVPLYDSAEDEPSLKLLKYTNSTARDETANVTNEQSDMELSTGTTPLSGSGTFVAKSMDSVPEALSKSETIQEMGLEAKDILHISMLSRRPCFDATGNVQHTPGGTSMNGSKPLGCRKVKIPAEKQVDPKLVIQMLSSKEAQQEVLMYEDIKLDAASELDSLYNEIRPVIEAHERQTQENLPTSLAEKWIEASCAKYKAEFDLYGSIIKNLICNLKSRSSESKLIGTDDMDADHNSEVLTYLTY